MSENSPDLELRERGAIWLKSWAIWHFASHQKLVFQVFSIGLHYVWQLQHRRCSHLPVPSDRARPIPRSSKLRPTPNRSPRNRSQTSAASSRKTPFRKTIRTLRTLKIRTKPLRNNGHPRQIGGHIPQPALLSLFQTPSQFPLAK